jgi:microspherule protein 1
VDVDLKLEGPAWKISRKQGIISLKNSGEFFISNIGQRHIFIDGKAVSKSNTLSTRPNVKTCNLYYSFQVRRGAHIRLYNNSVLEIGGLKFVFLINLDLIEAIRNEHTRIYVST